MSTAADRVEVHIGYLLIKLGVAAAARFEAALAPLGLRGRHIRVLESLHEEALSQQELCRRTGLDRTTMVAVLDELERLGFAHRERGRTDRRKHVVTLTEAGSAAFGSAAEHLTEAENEFLSPIGDGERAELHRLAMRLFEHQPVLCEPEPEAST